MGVGGELFKQVGEFGVVGDFDLLGQAGEDVGSPFVQVGDAGTETFRVEAEA